MSGGQVSINPAELRGLADQIRAEQNKLEAEVQKVCAEMRSLENDGIESPAGREIRSRFDKWRADYENKYPPAFRDYIQYCLTQADNYEQTDKRLLQEASNLSVSST